MRQLVWRPYELACRRLPLVPLRSTVVDVADGVRMIRIENGVTRAITRLGGGYDYSVSYLVDGSLMIDTGFPWARRSLRKRLLELGADATISTVVNTHCHEDHVGNNDLMCELCNVTIYAHPLGLADIRHPSELPLYRRFMFGPLSPSPVEPAPENIHTEHHRFEIHHLPGHSADHLCLFEPDQGWLFSGDLYVAADLDSQLNDVDGPAWIASLERALRLQPQSLFDAHGVIVEGQANVRILLERKHDFLLGLQHAIEQAASGTETLREITKAVFGDKGVVNSLSFSDGWLSLLTCSDFSRGNLVRSFLKATHAQAG